jgi:ABC-type protease/lipase transport system fused ATPase/permease subunit
MAPLTGDNPLREALGRGSGLLIVAFVLSLFYNLLNLTGPVFMLLVFDRVLPSKSEETLVTLFLLVVVLLGLLVLIDYARRRILARFGAQFQERIEERLFAAATKTRALPRASRKPMTGLDELDNLRGFFHSGAMIAVLDVFWAPLFLVVVFILHAQLGWVVLAGMALLSLIAVLRWMIAAGREERSRTAGRRVSDLKDILAVSRETIRNQEMTPAYRDRWIAAREEGRDRSVELRDMTTWFSAGARQVQGLVRYAVMALGAWLTLQGELTVGAMVAATFLAVRAVGPLDAFLDEAPAIWRSIGNWSSLRGILAARPLDNAGAAAGELRTDPAAVMALQRMTARAPVTGVTVLNTISASFVAGDLVEISGVSGAGKTLLAEVMLGLVPHVSGVVLYRGASVARLSSPEARRAFGYVPEVAEFVTGTIEENICRLDPEPDRARVLAAAQDARIHDVIMAQPDGYQTRIDAVDHPFSRGQRAQLALARALYARPDLLIFDEPDTVLRRMLRRDLRPVIEALRARGGLVLILAREPLSLRNATVQMVLDDGRLKPLPQAEEVSRIRPAEAQSTITPLIRG